MLVPPVLAAKCGGVNTSIIDCPDQDGSGGLGKNGVWGVLLLILNILTAGIGVAAVGGIVYGSILYTSSGGSMDQIKRAKDIIRNTVIGILAYALMFAFLNYLIPGGLFK